MCDCAVTVTSQLIESKHNDVPACPSDSPPACVPSINSRAEPRKPFQNSYSACIMDIVLHEHIFLSELRKLLFLLDSTGWCWFGGNRWQGQTQSSLQISAAACKVPSSPQELLRSDNQWRWRNPVRQSLLSCQPYASHLANSHVAR